MTNIQNSNTGSKYRVSHHDRWLDPVKTVDRWCGHPVPHTHHVTYLQARRTINSHDMKRGTLYVNKCRRQTWDNPDFTSTELTSWRCVVTTTKHQPHQQYQQHQTTHTRNAIKLLIFVCSLFCNYYCKVRQTPVSLPWDNLGKPATERLHQSGF